MKAENARQVQGLIELVKHCARARAGWHLQPVKSAWSGADPLTDIQLANRLDVDERTIRKWKSGETRMVFTTVLSVLAGRVGDAAGRTGLAGSDAFQILLRMKRR